MNRISYRTLAALAAVLALVTFGCAAEEPAAEAPAEEAAAPVPRVFFEDLQDGDEVPTILELYFGHENYVIEPVGDGMVHEGAGHFHIGIDTECLEAGVIIPTADPWIHFGDGSNTIEIELTPGEHKLALQIGDGEHRTQDDPGLCQVITVNAVEAPADGDAVESDA